VPQSGRIDRDGRAGMEVGEGAGPARERASTGEARKDEGAVASRDVARPGDDDDVGVE
jgi:hypothetical protein